MTLSLAAWPRLTGYSELGIRGYDTAALETLPLESGAVETVKYALPVEAKSAHKVRCVLDKTQCLVQVTPRGVAAAVAAARQVLV